MRLFFNQVQLHHPYVLPDVLRDIMLSTFAQDDLLRSVSFGDGTPIGEDVLQRIVDTYWRAASIFPWREGDVLVLDNMRVAQARRPFTGAREVVVAMADMVRADRFVASAATGGVASTAP